MVTRNRPANLTDEVRDNIITEQRLQTLALTVEDLQRKLEKAIADVKADNTAALAVVKADQVTALNMVKADQVTALQTADAALKKSETALEKRFESVNEFRQTLADQQASFVRKPEMEARFQNLSEQNDKINDRIADATAPQWGTLVSTGGLIVTLVGSLWFAGIQPIKERLGTMDEATLELHHSVDANEAAFQKRLDDRVNLFPTQFQFNEYKAGVDKALTRMDQIDTAKLSKDEFNAWKMERDKTLQSLQNRIDLNQERIKND